MPHSPTISVIIPAYNEEKLISVCIKALLNQDYPKEKYEVIVVDNNSTDSTVSIARTFPIMVLEYKKMNRVGAVRQYGASHAKGSILAFMDADSAAAPDWLSSIEKELSHERLVAVCGPALPMTKAPYLLFLFGLYNQVLRINQIIGSVLPWGFNLAIKKTAFDEIGGYNLSLNTYDDADLGLRIQKKFGRKGILYSQKLKVFTSTRKQENLATFFTYIVDTMRNYTNFVILKRQKAVAIRNVR